MALLDVGLGELPPTASRNSGGGGGTKPPSHPPSARVIMATESLDHAPEFENRSRIGMKVSH